MPLLVIRGSSIVVPICRSFGKMGTVVMCVDYASLLKLWEIPRFQPMKGSPYAQLVLGSVNLVGCCIYISTPVLCSSELLSMFILITLHFQLTKSKHYCGICKKIWNHSDSGKWVGCLSLSSIVTYYYHFMLYFLDPQRETSDNFAENQSLNLVYIGSLWWLQSLGSCWMRQNLQ